jgi:peptide/nickel transport system permease protein
MRAMKHLAQLLLSLAVTVLIGGFLTAALVRLSPGFGVDEHELDPTRDVAALRALAAARPEQGNFFAYSVRHTAAMFRGDLGTVSQLESPGGRLAPRTLAGDGAIDGNRNPGRMGVGLAFALPGLDLSQPDLDCAGRRDRRFALVRAIGRAGAADLRVRRTGARCHGAGRVSRVFQYLRNLLSHAAAQPHVMAARARGIGPGRILLWHIVPVAAPQMLALAGVSVSMAFGAAVAVEVVCDFPGIGQLAWKAALARDLPLLVTLTMLVTLATQMANALPTRSPTDATRCA